MAVRIITDNLANPNLQSSIFNLQSAV